MKKFKSMIAMTAAIMALTALSAPLGAFADDTTDAGFAIPHKDTQKYDYGTDDWVTKYDDSTKADTNNTSSAKINVAYGYANSDPGDDRQTANDPTYLVTIPADVKFGEPTVNRDAKTVSFEEKTNTLEVSEVFLNKGKAVQVTVASAHDYKLFLGGTDAETVLTYTMDTNKNTTNRLTATNTTVITVPTGTKADPASDTATLKYNITSNDIDVAGAYTDILTFTIAVVDAPAANTP